MGPTSILMKIRVVAKHQCRMKHDLLRYEPKLTYQALWPCETRASKPKGCSTPGALRSSGVGVIDLKLKIGKLKSTQGQDISQTIKEKDFE